MFCCTLKDLGKVWDSGLCWNSLTTPETMFSGSCTVAECWSQQTCSERSDVHRQLFETDLTPLQATEVKTFLPWENKSLKFGCHERRNVLSKKKPTCSLMFCRRLVNMGSVRSMTLTRQFEWTEHVNITLSDVRLLPTVVGFWCVKVELAVLGDVVCLDNTWSLKGVPPARHVTRLLLQWHHVFVPLWFS